MSNIYTGGEYLKQNPTWHEEDSPWKALQVQTMLARHPLPIRSIAEIGCGVGGILAQLRQTLPDGIEFHGFDIAAAAIASRTTSAF